MLKKKGIPTPLIFHLGHRGVYVIQPKQNVCASQQVTWSSATCFGRMILWCFAQNVEVGVPYRESIMTLSDPAN